MYKFRVAAVVRYAMEHGNYIYEAAQLFAVYVRRQYELGTARTPSELLAAYEACEEHMA